MSYVTDFQGGVTEVLKLGQQARIKYYNKSFGAGSYYDDDVTLTQSGSDLWISGVLLPITQTRGSNDAILLEQGKLLTTDNRFYITGTINTSGTIKVGLGSPIVGEYSVISEGITRWDVNQTPIVKKLYLRRLTNGSFVGE